MYFSGEVPFKKGTILHMGKDESVVVLKVYKKRWWKKFARFFGFKPVDQGIQAKLIK